MLRHPRTEETMDLLIPFDLYWSYCFLLSCNDASIFSQAALTL
ncbi:MAG: hypothetical protein QRY72_05790 [Candidatus Rhabdochlamydia sp.]